MANTRYLREVVEEYVREQLAFEYRKQFSAVSLPLTTGGNHEFDAVSEDRKVVASVKSASGLTAGGRIPSGKIKDSVAELYYLSLVDSHTRLLVLTTPEFHDIFVNTMKDKVASGVSVRCIPLPAEIQAEVQKVVAEASAEVSLERAKKAVDAEIEAEIDEEDSPT